MISTTIIIAFSTPAGIYSTPADSVTISDCTTYPEEQITQSHPNELACEFTVSASMITDFSERIKQQQKRSPYIGLYLQVSQQDSNCQNWPLIDQLLEANTRPGVGTCIYQ